MGITAEKERRLGWKQEAREAEYHEARGEVLCDCGEWVKESSLVYCSQCGHRGCYKCMLFDHADSQWFCDSDGDIKNTLSARLYKSECRQNYYKALQLRAHTADILSMIQDSLQCQSDVRMIAANYTLNGCEAVFRDNSDGQYYKFKIESEA